jgi:hypothetical protein
VIHNRIWASPNLAFFSLITKNLGRNPFHGPLNADYLLTSLSGPVLARVTGQQEAYEFARLHLLVAVVGCAGVVIAAGRRWGTSTALVFAAVLVLSPQLTVVMQWLGQPDAIFLPAVLAATIARPRWALVVCAVLLGVTHPEQAAFAVLTVGAARWALRETPVSWRLGALDSLVALAGVAAGRGITEVYFRVNDISITKSRAAFLDFGFQNFLDHHLQNPWWLVYCLWGPLWLVLIGLAVFARGAQTRALGVICGAATVALAPMLATLDETRVYAMITAPLLIVMARAIVELLDARSASLTPEVRRTMPSKVVWLALAVAVVVPGGFTAGLDSWSFQLPIVEMTRFLANGEIPARSEGDMSAWLGSPFEYVIPPAR